MRYFLAKNDEDWTEVDQAAFVSAERRCGFRPKPGCGPCATAGFSGTAGFLSRNGVRWHGTTTHGGEPEPRRFS